MKKDVNYYIWNDKPIQADYYTNVNLPHGGSIYTSIGAITIEKGDAIIVDFGRSFMEHTRSGKGPKAEFPFGKIILQGVSSNVILTEYKSTTFVKSTPEQLDIIIKHQQERINNIIPELTEKFVLEYVEKKEKEKAQNLKTKENQKKSVHDALVKMEAFFKPK